MNKKMMKRSLALGALMAFVITGSAMAADESYGSTMLDKDVTVSGGNLTYTATDKGADNPLGDGANRSYALAVNDGLSHAITLNNDKIININNNLTGTERNYGIRVRNNSELVVHSSIKVNASGIEKQRVGGIEIRGTKKPEESKLTIKGDLDISVKNNAGIINGVEAYEGGSFNVEGNTSVFVESNSTNIAGVRGEVNLSKDLSFNGSTTINVICSGGSLGWTQAAYVHQSVMNFNGNTVLNVTSGGDDTYTAGVRVLSDKNDPIQSRANFNGEKTDITITNANSRDRAVFVSGENAEANFNGNEVNVKVESSGYDQTSALSSQYGGRINSGKDTVVNLDVYNSYKKAYGIFAGEYANANGNLNLGGDINIVATSKEESYGIYNAASNSVPSDKDGKITVGGSTDIKSKSNEGIGYGVSSVGGYAETKLNGNVTIDAIGTAGSKAVYASENATVYIGSEGKNITILNGDIEAIKGGTINLHGNS